MKAKTARDEILKIAQEMGQLKVDRAFDLSAHLYRVAQAADDAREEHLRDKYARLIQAMSLDEAKRVLGLPAVGTPSADEISKAYKTLALQNHPDRGGDADKMVEINVARDVLLNAGSSEVSDYENDEREAEKFVSENFESMKGGGWWIPNHNLLLNQTMMGTCNLWVFSMLPLFPKKKAFNTKHNGIVIHPDWHPYDKRVFDMSLADVKKVYVAAKSSPTVQDTVRRELAWVESEFKIQIPEAIQSKLVKSAVTTAVRRWGADRLRTKDQVIPLDGSKPFPLSAWGW